MPSKYIPVRQGVYFHPKLGRIVNHQGHSTTIFWNSAMLDYLKRNFPRTLNDGLDFVDVPEVLLEFEEERA